MRSKELDSKRNNEQGGDPKKIEPEKLDSKRNTKHSDDSLGE
jgi:hypothetical protein